MAAWPIRNRKPHYHPPAWPDDASDKQFHLDTSPGETWRVLLDPAGHPFCLTLWRAG